MYTLDATDKHSVCYVLASSCVNAEITDGSVSPTLMARAGTGGNQLPLLCLNDYGGDVWGGAECIVVERILR